MAIKSDPVAYVSLIIEPERVIAVRQQTIIRRKKHSEERKLTE